MLSLIIFDACQRSSAVHNSHASLLCKSPPSPSALLNVVNTLLFHFSSSPPCKRLVAFIGKLLSKLPDDELALALIRHLLPHAFAESKKVRSGVAQLCATALKTIKSDIDDDLFTSLSETFLSLARDKIPGVRACAVVALERMQDPSDPECPVQAIYLSLLRVDASSQVRRAILECMGITRKTLPEMLLRARDAKPDVRASFFAQAEKRIPVSYLSVEERAALVECGLGDRVESVRAACAKMVKQWAAECGSAIGLLEELCVHEFEDVCEQMCKSVKFEKIAADAIIPLTSASAFYWQTHPSAKDTTLTELCVLMVDSLAREEAFVTNQLLKLSKKIDQDEVGKKRLQEMLVTMVETTGDAFPLAIEMLAADAEGSGIPRDLSVIRHLRRMPEALLDEVVLQKLESGDDGERALALECLGLACLHDKGLATDYLDVFKAMILSEESSSALCVKVLADLGMVHGLDVSAPILGALEDDQLQRVASESLAKLLHVGRLKSPTALQCLLVLLFHPSTEEDTKLRQCLAVFFPQFALSSAANQKMICSIALPLLRALIHPGDPESPLLTVPLEPVVSFLAYLLTKARQDDEEDEDGGGVNLHQVFGFELAREILAEPTGRFVRVFAKALNVLDVAGDRDDAGGGRLRVACSMLLAEDRLADAVAKRQIAKWEKKLSAFAEVDDGVRENIEAAVQEYAAEYASEYLE